VSHNKRSSFLRQSKYDKLNNNLSRTLQVPSTCGAAGTQLRPAPHARHKPRVGVNAGQAVSPRNQVTRTCDALYTLRLMKRIGLTWTSAYRDNNFIK